MKWKYNEPKHDDTRTIRRFLLFPKCLNGVCKWLCIAKIKQRYEGLNWADAGWHSITFVD
jgi:hypothetical protein